MLAFFIAKPPVPAVAKEFTMLSYIGIPPASRRIISMTVSPIYIPYIIRAVRPIFETSFPTFGPGTSARITCISLTERVSACGSIASTNTSTPIPPTKCVKLRQKSIPRPSDSISVSMLAPVVVKPDTVSKKASTKDGMHPSMTNGRAPISDMMIHDSPTVTNPSFAKISGFDGFFIVSSVPAATDRTIGIRNAAKALSPYITDTTSDGIISIPSTRTICPIIYETIL